MPDIFNPLKHPICLATPHWQAETAWMQHVPFALFAVSAARPRVFVELGSWRGVSYCAFCQAIGELKLDARCYAVDTWRGDEHAGNLGDEALFALREHHDPKYAAFSRLVQSTFDDAAPHFSDASIDLLHIDGFHTYDAVRHDFEKWLPKMSPRGIVLFHDTNVRERDFGVYKFWEEIAPARPNFAFLHGHGLGVLAVGDEIPEDLRFLFEADERETTLIRQFFFALGSRLEAIRQNDANEKLIAEQQKYIHELQTYERAVKSSRGMRAYRILKEEGVGGLLKKAAK